MPRIWERDPRQRQLTTIYVPQESGRLMPSAISDEIVLTHPAQPFSSALDTMAHVARAAAAGAVEVLSDPVPSGEVHWIHAFDASHNDTVTRRMTLSIGVGPGGVRSALAIDKASAQFQMLMSPRSLLLPPTYSLVAQVDIIGAGAVISMRFEFVRYVAAEIPPQL